MDREVLSELVERGLSNAQIAEELGRHPRIVAAWLREFELETAQAVRRRQNVVKPANRRPGTCPRHGEGEFAARGDGSWRCVKCRSESVSAWRRRRKEQLIAEAGGACVIYGYDRCPGALSFHHVDPTTKRFGIAHRGAGRSLASLRDELAKCVLLCANCHAEVEDGTVELPIE
jgi:hypothetical protein